VTVRRNIAANVAGRAWSVLSFYLFVPVYLHRLGAEAYGVVGFYSVLLGVLVIADLGLTGTFSRELARFGVEPDADRRRRDLTRTLETVYLGISAVIAIAVVVAAPWIADRWLQSRTLPHAELVEALRLMGVTIALQLPANFYFGGLLGLERLVSANVLTMLWGLARSGGAALALLAVPSLRAFFLVVLAANLLYLLATRLACWRALGPGPARVRFELFRETWHYSAGMALLAVLSPVLVALDRLVVSRLLPLEAFAHYTLASSLAQLPVILATAIAGATFPRLTRLHAEGRADELRGFYHAACQLVAVATIPLGLTLAAFCAEVLGFWSRSEATVGAAATAGAILLAGSTALALQMVPFQMALAAGWVTLSVRLTVASLVVLVPLLYVLVTRWGLPGAATGWLLLNVLTTPFLILPLHRRVLPGATAQWLFTDVGRPLLASVAVIALARFALPRGAGGAASFVLAALAGAVALVAAALVAPAGRRWLADRRAAASTP
jgi:O-antigen/teichoic acid export membrane protein